MESSDSFPIVEQNGVTVLLVGSKPAHSPLLAVIGVAV
jgi:hypothetical protein